MNHLSEFGINIQRLENREYVFDFRIDDQFFRNFENSPIDHCELNCAAVINKTSSFIRVNFQIRGWIELICDRSLDPFEYPLNIPGQLILKYGNEEAEVDEEISIISRNRHEINLSQNIYELISTAVPMKKLHPRYAGETDGNDELIYSTEDENMPGKEDSEVPDPRWEALKKLKENNKN